MGEKNMRDKTRGWISGKAEDEVSGMDWGVERQE